MKDKEQPPETRRLPPYLPWKTFAAFIDRLKTTVVPPRIDTSMMPSMSGAVRSQLMSCMKFLDLVDSSGTVLDPLRTLVSAYGTDKWKDTLGQVIFNSYAEVTEGLDLDAGTSAQLYEKFRAAAGVEGAMLERVVRFYLAALNACGVTYSPHFTVRKAPTISARKKPRSGAGAGTGEDDDDRERNLITPPAGAAKFSFPIPGKASVSIVVPQDLEEEDWSMIDTMMRAYVARRGKTEKQSGAG